MTSKDTLRGDRAALVTALQQAGVVRFTGDVCCCPFHEDSRPSAGIFKRDGIWRFKCHSCGVAGDVFDIRARVDGTALADELRKASGPTDRPYSSRAPKSNGRGFASLDAVRQYLISKVGNIEAEHVYTDIAGDYIQTVFRCQTPKGKTYRPVHLTDSGYVLKAVPAPRPLYNLPKVVGAEQVIITEGEKAADALSRYGFAATTSSGGAKNAKHTNWEHLGGKSAIIWPDHDAEGRRYAADVEGILRELQPATRLSIIEPSRLDLGEHEDAADYVEQLQVLGKTDAQITTAIDGALATARALSIASEVRQRIADIAAGRYAAISLPWLLLNNLSRPLLPGTVTLLAGSPGATKSFMVLQAFAYWARQGLRVALCELEEDRTFHLTRALAQEASCAGLTDPEWVKGNAEHADELAVEYGAFLDNLGRALYVPMDDEPTLNHLAEWIETQAEKGCRIIGADPVTAAARTGDPWTADSHFLHRVKAAATVHGVSVLLVTHPIKSVTFPDLTQVAGSACYQRFSQTVFWLQHHDPKESRVRTACGTTELEHDRTLIVLKSRNGKGGGFRLAFDFDVEGLSLRELGVILPKKK